MSLPPHASVTAEHCHTAEYLLQKGWKLCGAGFSRTSLLSPRGKFLVKIPRNDDGVQDNYNESDNYNCLVDRRGRLAKCRMVPGTHLLMMEFVRVVYYNQIPSPIPMWVDTIDCQQVGYTRDGRLVAYDYG